VVGYAKNEQANISPQDLSAYKKLAALYLSSSAANLAALLRDGDLLEVPSDDD
jgi:hypothetical protein